MTLSEVVTILPDIREAAKSQWGDEIVIGMGGSFNQIFKYGWKRHLDELFESDNPVQYLRDNQIAKTFIPVDSKNRPVENVFYKGEWISVKDLLKEKKA